MGKWFAFILGLLLFLSSLPLTSLMLVELVHDKRMDMRYKIEDVSQGYPPTPSKYVYHENLITIEETLNEKEGFTDAWENEMEFADLVLKVNGNRIDRLTAYPVRKYEEGLNRYFGDIAYFLVNDKKKNTNSFIVVLKRTKEMISAKPNGDLVGMGPEEELMYTYYKVNTSGEVERKNFDYVTRDGFETKLLTKGYLASTAVGYYTNVWHGFPSIFFPFLYPFFTVLLGGILIVRYRPFWRKKI